MGLGLDRFSRERDLVGLVLAAGAPSRASGAPALVEDASPLLLLLADRTTCGRRTIRRRHYLRLCLRLVLGRLLSHTPPRRHGAALGLANHTGPAGRDRIASPLARAQASHHTPRRHGCRHHFHHPP